MKSYESWYSRNKEKGREQRRAYYEVNKDQMNERVRSNYRNNINERLDQIKEWKKANPHKVRVMAAGRTGSVRGEATKEQVAARIAFFGGLCAYCGVSYEHLDHAISLASGGTNWASNLRPACASCNLSKNKKTWRLVSLGSIVGGCDPDEERRYRRLCGIPDRDLGRSLFDPVPKFDTYKHNYILREVNRREYLDAMGIKDPYPTPDWLQKELFFHRWRLVYGDVVATEMFGNMCRCGAD